MTTVFQVDLRTTKLKLPDLNGPDIRWRSYYENQHGESWVAYLRQTGETYALFITGADIDWEPLEVGLVLATTKRGGDRSKL